MSPQNKMIAFPIFFFLLLVVIPSMSTAGQQLQGDGILGISQISKTNNSITFNILYTCNPQHGSVVYLGGSLYYRGQPIGAGFIPKTVPISQYLNGRYTTQNAQLTLSRTDNQPLVSDMVEAFLYEPNGTAFVKTSRPLHSAFNPYYPPALGPFPGHPSWWDQIEHRISDVLNSPQNFPVIVGMIVALIVLLLLVTVVFKHIKTISVYIFYTIVPAVVGSLATEIILQMMPTSDGNPRRPQLLPQINGGSGVVSTSKQLLASFHPISIAVGVGIAIVLLVTLSSRRSRRRERTER